MCGRYYVDEDTAKEIQEVIRDLDRKLALEAGDVRPSEPAVVLTGKYPRLTADRMQWGFPQPGRKGLLINARAESALERISFRDSVRHRRCIIPAAHFYEWNKAKEKATFCRKDSPVLYMAGIWNHFETGDRFVILTTQANASFVRRKYGYFLDTERFLANELRKYREYVKLPDGDYSSINPEHIL